jgi:predicted RNase H-like nuclease (RuvC/YqgF family)
MLGLVDWGEVSLLAFRVMGQQQVEMKAAQHQASARVQQRVVADLEQRMAAATQPSADQKQRLQTLKDQLEKDAQEIEHERKNMRTLAWWHKGIYRIKTILPKTGETKDMLDRYLYTAEDRKGLEALGERQQSERPQQSGQPDPAQQQAAAKELQIEYESRSVKWAIGTSLLFEAIVLSLAAWIFCRRDY